MGNGSNGGRSSDITRLTSYAAFLSPDSLTNHQPPPLDGLGMTAPNPPTLLRRRRVDINKNARYHKCPPQPTEGRNSIGARGTISVVPFKIIVSTARPLCCQSNKTWARSSSAVGRLR